MRWEGAIGTRYAQHRRLDGERLLENSRLRLCEQSRGNDLRRHVTNLSIATWTGTKGWIPLESLMVVDGPPRSTPSECHCQSVRASREQNRRGEDFKRNSQTHS